MRHAKVMAEQIFFEIYDVLPPVGLMDTNNCCWFRAFENLGDLRSLNTNKTSAKIGQSPTSEHCTECS